MLEITHQEEPNGLAGFRRQLQSNGIPITGKSWDDFKDFDKNRSHRELIEALFSLQHGCCAYCERPLSPHDCHVDHIAPRGNRETQHRTLEYTNLVLSCNTPQSCGSSKRNNTLPITPTVGANRHFQLIGASGKIQPCDRLSATMARICIHSVLNLNLALYCEERRQAVERIRTHIRRLEELGMSDEIGTYLRETCQAGHSYSATLSKYFQV